MRRRVAVRAGQAREDERVVARANPSRTTVESVLARALAATDTGPRTSEGQGGDGKEVWDSLAPSGKEGRSTGSQEAMASAQRGKVRAGAAAPVTVVD